MQKEIFRFKIDTVPSTFTFWFFSSLLLSSLSLPEFPRWTVSTLGFISVKRLLRSKDSVEVSAGGKWSEIFIGISVSNWRNYGVLRFSSACLTESCPFWFDLKDLYPLRKLDVRVVLDCKIDYVASNTKDINRHGQLWSVQGWTELVCSLF